MFQEQGGMKIFIVEDDPIIARSLAKELESWNFQPVIATDFEAIDEEFRRESPHLVLLDIVLPHYNGYHWCQMIRKTSQVPIIFISSRGENMDIVMAMQFGGDDYITKPIDLTVTVAKIRALLRRSYNFVAETNRLTFAGVQLSLSDAKLYGRDGEVEITRTELKIMEALFRGKGSFVLRSHLLEQCWQGDEFIDDNTLAVNMTRLRKKLADIGHPKFIVTKKNVGYALREESHD